MDQKVRKLTRLRQQLVFLAVLCAALFALS